MLQQPLYIINHDLVFRNANTRTRIVYIIHVHVLRTVRLCWSSCFDSVLFSLNFSVNFLFNHILQLFIAALSI